MSTASARCALTRITGALAATVFIVASPAVRGEPGGQYGGAYGSHAGGQYGGSYPAHTRGYADTGCVPHGQAGARPPNGETQFGVELRSGDVFTNNDLTTVLNPPPAASCPARPYAYAPAPQPYTYAPHYPPAQPGYTPPNVNTSTRPYAPPAFSLAYVSHTLVKPPYVSVPFRGVSYHPAPYGPAPYGWGGYGPAPHYVTGYGPPTLHPPVYRTSTFALAPYQQRPSWYRPVYYGH